MASANVRGILTADQLENAGHLTSGTLQSRRTFTGGAIGKGKVAGGGSGGQGLYAGYSDRPGGGGGGPPPAPAVVTSGMGSTKSIRYRKRRIRWMTVIGIPVCLLCVLGFIMSHTVRKARYNDLRSRHTEVLKYCAVKNDDPTVFDRAHYQEESDDSEDAEEAQERIPIVSHRKCKEACQNFDDCCNIFDNGFVAQNYKTGAGTGSRAGGSLSTTTCYQQNAFHCYQDAKCHILTNEIPPSPKALHSICDPSHLGYSEEQCHNVCNHARCCWDQPLIPSCLSEQYETCQDYSSCYNLRPAFTHNKNIVYIAPTNLEALCDPNNHDDDDNDHHNINDTTTTSSQEQCTEICALAQCCTDAHSDCYRDNFVACLSHLPCNTVFEGGAEMTIAPAYSQHSKPPEEIFQLCSVPEIIFNDNPQPCQELCQEKACCWESGIDNCFGDDPLGCLHYIGCQLLTTPHGSLDLKSISGTTSPRSYQEFQDANRHNVPAASGSIAALFKDKYVNGNYMGMINENGTDITTMIRSRTFMHAVCDATSLFADRTPCEQECTPSLPCCDPYNTALNDHGACFIEKIDICYDYSRCHTLTSGVRPASLQLDDNCSPDAIKEDRETCENLCQDVECCWNRDVVPCYDTKLNVCLDYGMCQNLRSDATISVSPKWLDGECSQNSTRCDTECATTEFCCTDPFSDCYRNNMLACISYGSCPGHATSTHIAPLHTVLPSLLPEVGTFCSRRYINLNSNDDCRRVCQPADCCFQSGGKNCFGNDPLGCLEHRDCGVLHYDKFPNFASDVKEVCTEEKVDGQISSQFDRAKCENACSHIKHGGNCCDPYHSTGDDACYHDNLGGCFAYARCHVMDLELAETVKVKEQNEQWKKFGDKIPLPPQDNSAAPDSIGTVCESSAIESDRTACEAMCEPARCCWDFERQTKRDDNKTAIVSCIDKKFPYCLDYAMCQNLRTNVYATLYAGNRTDELDGQPGKPLSVRSLDLDSLCLKKDIQCFQICGSASKCCNHIYSDCYRDNFISCLAHGECKKYFGVNLHVPTLNNYLAPPTTFPVHADIAIVCDAAYVHQHGDAQCQQVCYPASCCWEHGTENDGNCFGNDPLACMQYMQCRVLIANKLMSPYSNTINNPFYDNDGN